MPRGFARLTLASLIIWLGFGLRLYRLANNAIWWDEAWGVVLARLPLAESLLRTASDEHPPLYYWSLHFWRLVSGDTPFATRFFSVLAGTLTLAVVYRVGRQTAGTRVGLLAALFLALSRFHILWSQEVKMYALGALLGVSSMGFLFNWVKPTRRWRDALGYGLCALGAIYSHYIALLLIAAQGLAGLWWGLECARRVGWRWLGEWLALQAALVLLLIPWALYLLSAPHPSFTAPPAIPGLTYLEIIGAVLTVGVSTQVEVFRLSMWFVIALSAASWPLMWADRPTRRLSSRVVWLNLILPLGMIYALSHIPSAELFAPKFDSRYLFMLTPYFMLAVGWGVHQWMGKRRMVGLGLAALVVLIQIPLWPGYYLGRQLSADFASAMKTMANFAQPTDGVLLYTDKDWPVFEYYNNGRMPWAGFPSRSQLSPDEVAGRVDPLTVAHTAVWVLVTPDSLALDPERQVTNHLAAILPLAADLSIGAYRLQLYSASPRPLQRMFLPPEPEVRLEAHLSSALQFIGYDLPTREVAPGDYFPVHLYLDSTRAEIVNLQLTDARGLVRREVSATVEAGVNFIVHALPVSSAWPSGVYRLRLIQSNGVGLDFATVTLRNAPVTGSPPASFPNPRADNFGNLIRLEGTSAVPAEVKPGQSVALTLYWCAQAETRTNYTVFVHLLGDSFNLTTNNFLWGQVDSEPLAGRSPTSSWTTGQCLADPYVVQLSPDAPPGNYHIEVGLYDRTTGVRLPVLTSASAGLSEDAVRVGMFRVP